jgi:hypothetical protein
MDILLSAVSSGTTTFRLVYAHSVKQQHTDSPCCLQVPGAARAAGAGGAAAAGAAEAAAGSGGLGRASAAEVMTSLLRMLQIKLEWSQGGWAGGAAAGAGAGGMLGDVGGCKSYSMGAAK